MIFMDVVISYHIFHFWHTFTLFQLMGNTISQLLDIDLEVLSVTLPR
jgi:hypothetical protein